MPKAGIEHGSPRLGTLWLRVQRLNHYTEESELGRILIAIWLLIASCSYLAAGKNNWHQMWGCVSVEQWMRQVRLCFLSRLWLLTYYWFILATLLPTKGSEDRTFNWYTALPFVQSLCRTWTNGRMILPIVHSLHWHHWHWLQILDKWSYHSSICP